MVITERLTWGELRRRYPNEWVMLVDLRWLDDQLASGVAIGHGVQRSLAIADGLPVFAPQGTFACFYTGAADPPASRFTRPRPTSFDRTEPMFLPRLAG